MAERFLTYSPYRRLPWTEHSCFPAKAIKIWRGDPWRSKDPFRVYRIHEGGDTITEIPEREWDDYGKAGS